MSKNLSVDAYIYDGEKYIGKIRLNLGNSSLDDAKIQKQAASLALDFVPFHREEKGFVLLKNDSSRYKVHITEDIIANEYLYKLWKNRNKAKTKRKKRKS